MLLQTKLTMPHMRICMVTRPRLTAQLDEGVAGCVTIVSAPAGFGKTTLIADWAQQRKMQLAWLSLSENDNNLKWFWRYVIGALQTVVDGIGQQALLALEKVTDADWERSLTMLINEISETATTAVPLILVLDDYHFVHINTIHQSLSFLLHHQPKSLHVIILTRADPPLALARLRVQGRLQELRAADLQFTSEEMVDFFNCALDSTLSPGALVTLSEQVEGWAAGLQLAALSLKSLPEVKRDAFVQDFDGTQRYVFHYLLEEVLQRQPERVQSFLLKTAVLPYLSPALCSAVTGDEDAGQILAQLAEDNLFITPLNENEGWYRYHRLFASVLQIHLEKTNPGHILELRQRAADYLAGQGLSAEFNGISSILLDPLTERELEILTLIAQGQSNQQIADQLFISVGTVKGHINHLLSKMGAQNRTEAVALARRLGYLKT